MRTLIKHTLACAALAAALAIGWNRTVSVAGSDIVFGSNPSDAVSSPRQYACLRAKQNVQLQGFAHVRMIECKGKHYSFQGYRDGKWWKVKVRARNGKIRRAYPL